MLTKPGKLNVEVFLVDLRPSQSRPISSRAVKGGEGGLLLLTKPGKLHVEVFLVDFRPSQSRPFSKSCREGM